MKYQLIRTQGTRLIEADYKMNMLIPPSLLSFTHHNTSLSRLRNRKPYSAARRDLINVVHVLHSFDKTRHTDIMDFWFIWRKTLFGLLHARLTFEHFTNNWFARIQISLNQEWSGGPNLCSCQRVHCCSFWRNKKKRAIRRSRCSNLTLAEKRYEFNKL